MKPASDHADNPAIHMPTTHMPATHMPATHMPATHMVDRYAVLDSTNGEAVRRARAGARGPIWIAADVQTAGRGRQQRQWVSRSGNLHVSLLFSPGVDLAQWPQLAFVAGLALRDAVIDVLGSEHAQLLLKWPNDVLYSGRKLAGILIETYDAPQGPMAIIGWGVNCGHAPEIGYPTTSLAEMGAVIAPMVLLPVLASHFEDRRHRWRGGAGFAGIRDDWLASAYGLGQKITVRVGDQCRTGRFEGIDADGTLLMNDGANLRTIRAGDVSFHDIRGMGGSSGA